MVAVVARVLGVVSPWAVAVPDGVSAALAMYDWDAWHYLVPCAKR